MRFDPSRLSPVVTVLYRLWVRSIRFHDALGMEPVRACLDSGRPAMLALWHEELFALTGYGSLAMHGRAATVVSDSRDGELIAQVLERIGYATARGSSTRGGLKALGQLRKHMQAGCVGVLTVDGPRGPRHKVKDGAVYLAQKSGALLFPVRSRPSSMHVFERSWDHFQLPLPFCACEVRIGEPLSFAPGKMSAEDMAQGSLRLEQALHDTLPDKA
jgi:lysophospholipid acyltransferase (LPLAT)-like uncharacterized protein